MAIAARTDPVTVIGSIAVVLAVIAWYWLPTFIGWRRQVRGFGQVAVVNLLFGWTVIGWFVALVMAFRDPRAPATR